MSDLISEETVALQEKQEKAQQNFLLLPMEQVVENTRNPNHMDPQEYIFLKEAIDKSEGNKNGPIVIRKHPDQLGKYQIID